MEVLPSNQPAAQMSPEETAPKLKFDVMIIVFKRLPTSELIRFISNSPNSPLGSFWSVALRFVVEQRLPFSLKRIRSPVNPDDLPPFTELPIDFALFDCVGSRIGTIKHPEVFPLSPLRNLVEVGLFPLMGCLDGGARKVFSVRNGVHLLLPLSNLRSLTLTLDDDCTKKDFLPLASGRDVQFYELIPKMVQSTSKVAQEHSCGCLADKMQAGKPQESPAWYRPGPPAKPEFDVVLSAELCSLAANLHTFGFRRVTQDASALLKPLIGSFLSHMTSLKRLVINVALFKSCMPPQLVRATRGLMEPKIIRDAAEVLVGLESLSLLDVPSYGNQRPHEDVLDFLTSQCHVIRELGVFATKDMLLELFSAFRSMPNLSRLGMSFDWSAEYRNVLSPDIPPVTSVVDMSISLVSCGSNCLPLVDLLPTFPNLQSLSLVCQRTSDLLPKARDVLTARILPGLRRISFFRPTSPFSLRLEFLDSPDSLLDFLKCPHLPEIVETADAFSLPTLSDPAPSHEPVLIEIFRAMLRNSTKCLSVRGVVVQGQLEELRTFLTKENRSAKIVAWKRDIGLRWAFGEGPLHYEEITDVRIEGVKVNGSLFTVWLCHSLDYNGETDLLMDR